MADMGFSYQPGGDGGMQRPNGPGGQSVSPQEALRVLSFRVPKRPNTFAPGSLLPGAPSGGGMDAGALSAIVGQLMKLMQPGGGGSADTFSAGLGRENAMNGRGGFQNMTFKPTGGAGSVVPQMSPRPYQAPTFTPGSGEGKGVQDLFGNDVAQESGGGMKQDVGSVDAGPPDISNTFHNWLGGERDMNGRGFDLSGLMRG